MGSEHSEPRKIHGRDGIVLLVGRVYKCSQKGHEVVSYHPGILHQIKAQSLIMFRLWLRTGYTTDIIRSIETMILSGVRMSAIQKSLEIAQYSLRFTELQQLNVLNLIYG